MFTSDLDKSEYPLRARGWGIFLGSVILISVAAALVSAKTVPFLFVVTVASFLAAAAMRNRLSLAVPARGPVLWYLAIFLLYASASTTWAADPENSFLIIALSILIAAGAFILLQLFPLEERPSLLHMGEGLWTGFIVALVYLLIELTTDQGIKIWFYNAIGITPDDVRPAGYFKWSDDGLIAISPEDLTRNMAPVVLFLWPAVLVMWEALPRPWRTLLPSLVVLVTGIVVMIAPNETAKLAFATGLFTFVSACLMVRLTGRLLAIGWVCACLAILPAALVAHRLDLHNATWLQPTARHRIIIWNYTAEQLLNAPWFGIGARSTYVLGPQLEREITTPSDEAFRRTLSIHSHNIYLQTWFELGLIGATLLTMIGLSMLQSIRQLNRSLQPFAYTTFACASVMAASSYGMWQIWFMSLFGYCAAVLGLGCALAGRSPPKPASGQH